MSMKILNKRLKEIIDVAKKDLSTFDIFNHMNEMLQLVNLDRELRREVDAWNGKVLVFEATDSGRSVSISFSDGAVIGRIRNGGGFNLKFQATEKTYIELLTGELDPDSAFFRRKIRIIGPVIEALKLKNILFAKVLAR